MWRQEIFETDRDRGHFIELLAGMVERYNVVLHAYMLMGNHYHLLIETPEGNASRALQWLNLSYAAWFNAAHERSGPLFQARSRGRRGVVGSHVRRLHPPEPRASPAILVSRQGLLPLSVAEDQKPAFLLPEDRPSC